MWKAPRSGLSAPLFPTNVSCSLLLSTLPPPQETPSWWTFCCLRWRGRNLLQMVPSGLGIDCWLYTTPSPPLLTPPLFPSCPSRRSSWLRHVCCNKRPLCLKPAGDLRCTSSLTTTSLLRLIPPFFLPKPRGQSSLPYRHFRSEAKQRVLASWKKRSVRKDAIYLTR